MLMIIDTPTLAQRVAPAREFDSVGVALAADPAPRCVPEQARRHRPGTEAAVVPTPCVPQALYGHLAGLAAA